MELTPVGNNKSRRGYPVDWIETSVGEFKPFVTSGSRGWAAYYSTNGDLFVRITNMDRRSIDLNLDDSRYVSLPESEKEGIRTQLKEGDVIISITADIGIISFIGKDVPSPAYINQHISLVRFQPEVVCAKFVSYFLAHWPTQRWFRSITDQGAKAGINLDAVRHIELVVPPTTEEQRAIATALSDVDALLDGLDRLIAKKRDIKQATMQQLLTGKTRLPGFDGEWEFRSLIEIAEYQKSLFDDGDWVEAEHITDQGIRLVQTGNIGIGTFVEKEARKYIYEESFTTLRCKELRVGDVLICRLAEPAGRACLFPDIGEERVITSVDVTIFRPRKEVADRRFIVQYCSTNNWFLAVLDNVGGTTHKRISRGALGKISIPFPTIDEQGAIADVLVNMDAELEALEKRRAKTRDLKQAMMQELLTGRTRLV